MQRGTGREELGLARDDVLRPDHAGGVVHRHPLELPVHPVHHLDDLRLAELDLGDAGRLEDAAAAFDESITLVADSRTMAYRGNVAALLGDLPDAERRLAAAAAVALKPRDRADALNSRGVVLEALDRIQDAADCYERALDAVPGHAKARANRDALL